MGKYAKYQRTSTKVRPTPIHPIWRGIGCILWVLVPLMSYALASITVALMAPTGLIPYGLLGYIPFSYQVLNIPVLGWLAQFIGGVRDLGAIAIFFVVFVVVLTGIATTLYAVAYRSFGPARYSPIDAPPARYKWGRKPRG